MAQSIAKAAEPVNRACGQARSEYAAAPRCLMPFAPRFQTAYRAAFAAALLYFFLLPIVALLR
ncbi:hypothetical protein ACG2K1_09240 [Neisseria sp. 23W00296]|uniref:hypothetical protein n=1 Tax=unclassified Neisseria TaxID=2623750 RepID=UPI0002A3699D|nr:MULTISPECIES: hypothetical protein [unclassified Neisseria]ASP17527.1 hypothetical protein CGZ77_07080 [Neisseria sp. KEM232]EKY09832.1 hypothetical protein HMPREF9120_00264 [Neisseria sp. oral taxon 020 str. F0370]